MMLWCYNEERYFHALKKIPMQNLPFTGIELGFLVEGQYFTTTPQPVNFYVLLCPQFFVHTWCNILHFHSRWLQKQHHFSTCCTNTLVNTNSYFSKCKKKKSLRIPGIIFISSDIDKLLARTL